MNPKHKEILDRLAKRLSEMVGREIEPVRVESEEELFSDKLENGKFKQFWLGYILDDAGKVIGLSIIRFRELRWRDNIIALRDIPEEILEFADSLKFLILRKNELRDISLVGRLNGLQALDLSGNNINDIGVLKELESLKKLYLIRNKIIDISVLRNLKDLQVLKLSWNEIENIIVLKELKKLEVLSLSGNNISDFSILRDLRNLRKLYLSSIGIEDISFLRELKDLEVLYLSRNQINDFSVLKDLKKLRELNLASTGLEDISFLRELKDLEKLSISRNEIKELKIEGGFESLRQLTIQGKVERIGFRERLKIGLKNLVIKDLKSLEKLDLSWNELTTIELKQLDKLRDLDLSSNNLTDLSFLSGLKNVEVLNLSANHVSIVSPLQKLNNLRELYLSDNQIKEIEPLLKLNNLEELDISENGIEELRIEGGFESLKVLKLTGGYGDEKKKLRKVSISKLQSLRELDLSDNEIVYVELEALPNLRDLNLSSNILSDLSFLSGLQSVEILNLSDNYISDVSSLQKLLKLRELYLSDNQIKEEEIEQLRELKNLDKLNISGNGIEKLRIEGGFESLRELTIQGKEEHISFMKSRKIGLNSLVIKDLKNLEKLDLSRNELTTIELKHLDKLRDLDLSSNNLSDLSFLSGLKSVEILKLRGNQISNLRPLQELNNLRKLYLSDNQIKEIEPLLTLKNLEILDISGNEIKELEIEGGFERLRELTIRGKIERISFRERRKIGLKSLIISDLKNLEKLDLSRNELIRVELKQLNKLWYLDLSLNNIRELSFLKELQTIEVLNLRENKISDISPLRVLKHLNKLDVRENYFKDLAWKDLKDFESSDFNIIVDIENLILTDLKTLYATSSNDRFRNSTITLSVKSGIKNLKFEGNIVNLSFESVETIVLEHFMQYVLNKKENNKDEKKNKVYDNESKNILEFSGNIKKIILRDFEKKIDKLIIDVEEMDTLELEYLDIGDLLIKVDNVKNGRLSNLYIDEIKDFRINKRSFNDKKVIVETIKF